MMDAPGAARFDLRGLIENSLLEWDDHIATVAIAGGCNWRCPYCHSWRYVTGLDDLIPRDIDELFRLLERQRGWIDGVVFTGGEPTLQSGLGAVVARVRDEFGVKVKLHSNGTRPAVIAELLRDGALDCLALDYKAPLDHRLSAAAGVSEGDPAVADPVRESFRLAAASGVAREYHTTLSPRFIAVETLAEMGEALEADGVWYLQQYENGDCLNPAAAGERRFTNAELDVLEETALARHRRVVLKRGKSA